jgi:DNA-directed RNA polymerase specialized sigma24 family protein
MARLMGLSHAQIAAELGKSEVAVRSILSRALAELAECL